MRESAFWGQVRDGMSNKIHWTRIENAASPGIPDVTGCMNGVEAWVELKVMKARRVEIRHSQVNWATKRIKAGADTLFFLVRDGEQIKVWRGRDMVNAVMIARRYVDAHRVRVDKDSMTFEPSIVPALVLEVNDPTKWDRLESFIFRSRYA